MFISAIQELSFHRKTGVTLKWRTRFLLCVEQCSKDSILLMCVECIPALYPYGNSWVVGKALWHIKTRHHQDFHLDDAWFMFSNPVRQMPYISNFRGLLFYDHPSNRAACILEKLLELYALTNRIGYGKLYALCGVAGARHLRHIAAALEAERRRAVRAGGDALAADRDNRTGQRCARTRW